MKCFTIFTFYHSRIQGNSILLYVLQPLRTFTRQIYSTYTTFLTIVNVITFNNRYTSKSSNFCTRQTDLDKNNLKSENYKKNKQCSG